jgi:spermidine/putrescine transport system ATP-binding protein
VADFLGVSNLMPARIVSAGPSACRVAVDGYELETRGTETHVSGDAKIVIRPERVELEDHGSPAGPNRIPGMVERLVYVGSAVQVIIHSATGETLQALVQNKGTAFPFDQGTPVQLHLPADALRVLPSGTGDEASLKGEEGQRAEPVAAGD